MRRFLRLFFTAFLWFGYLFSGFVKKKKGLHVYGCPSNKFYENAKYAFLKASSSKDNKSYWVTDNNDLIRLLRSNGLNVVKRSSIFGVWICLRASNYYFSSYVSDINFWTSRGAFLINYWHGVPLKMIERSIKSGPLQYAYSPDGLVQYIKFIWKKYTDPGIYKKVDKIYVPREEWANIYQEAFAVDYTALVFDSYPRVNFIAERTWENYQGIFQKNKFSMLDENSILYLPTFRDGRDRWFFEYIFSNIDFHNEFLLKKNKTLYIKFHPMEGNGAYKDFSNIKFVSSNIDTHEILFEYKGVVITDYSSIMFDCLELGIPIYLYWPDIFLYKTESRDLYFSLEDFFNNEYFENFHDVINAIEDNFGFINSKIIG